MSGQVERHPDTPGSGGYGRAVKVWLFAGLVMIFVQVVVGGITRLTGSGLSITRWEIVTGTLPPLNEEQWDAAFDLYKATPQYAKINEGMSMADFRFIYFWEYIHRLWARLMGFVFIIPLGYFLWKGYLRRPLLRRLGIVFLLACLAASFGWIMVASGLVDRPWVNAYKLTVHLSIALALFGYLFWTTIHVIMPDPRVIHNKLLKKGTLSIFILLSIQIVLGGVMSGMKAALYYPTWPDMNGALIPGVLLDPAMWTPYNFLHYDRSPFMAALVQTLHRFVAYTLIIISLWFSFRALQVSRSIYFRFGIYTFAGLLLAQASLGVLTLVHAIGVIPVGLGVMHQAVALLLLANVIFLRYMAISPGPGPVVENYVENSSKHAIN